MRRGGKRKSYPEKRGINKTKKKGKFNFRQASYIKEREFKNEEIESRRKWLEENKVKRQKIEEESSESEPEDSMKTLLDTFTGTGHVKKMDVVSDSESNSEEDEDDEEIMGIDVDDEEILEEGDSDIEDMQKDDEDVENESESDNSDEEVKHDSKGEAEEVQEEGEEEEEGDSMEEKDSDECEIHIEECDEDDETEREDAGHCKDPFSVHLRNELDNKLYEVLSNPPISVERHVLKWPTLKNITCDIPKVESTNESTKSKVTVLEEQCFAKCGTVPESIHKINWDKLYIKSQIQGNITRANYMNIKDNLDNDPSPLTPLQKELFSIINNYQDLLYSERTFSNAEEIRFIYCLHAINHVLKTRTKVLHHNAKIQKSKLTGVSDIPDEYRDQGLVRPRVLILVPFRHSCLKVVELLISILIGERKGGSVINQNRFMEDFGGAEVIMPKKNPKPEDYELTFKGNTDDTFKIGISVTKKALKLYTDFYNSDIIISSVLGLRMLIGAKGEADRDHDFLASIELLIMDQMDICYMQNWEHLIHVLNHMHLQPKESHGVDFGRVRSWCVNGWSKYYRQTLMFSSIKLPEINSIFSKRCSNYAGKVMVNNPVLTGSICEVTIQIPQIFHRFEAANHSRVNNARFEFFTTKILPQYKDSIMNHTLIYVPSYFDFVKLRNYFDVEDLNFVQVCEYSEDRKVAKARDMFFHSDAHFVLYTERFHFFRRIQMKGIRHIIFYAPPVIPHFYSEMCNLMHNTYQNPKSGSDSNMTVTMIYCKFDVLSLSSILSTEKVMKMMNSDRDVHMIITGG